MIRLLVVLVLAGGWANAQVSLTIPQIPPAPSLPLTLSSDEYFVFGFGGGGWGSTPHSIEPNSVPAQSRCKVIVMGRHGSGASQGIWFLQAGGEVIIYENMGGSVGLRPITSLPNFFKANIVKFYSTSGWPSLYLGISTSGQLGAMVGLGNSTPSLPPSVIFPEGSAGVVEILPSLDAEASFLSLHSNGSIKAWATSANNLSQISHVAEQIANVRVLDGSPVTGLALDGNGQVFGWLSPTQTMPIPAAAAAGVVQIAAPPSGEFLSYALKGDGTIVAWDMQGNSLSLPESFLNKQFVRIVSMSMGRAFGLTTEGQLLGWYYAAGVAQEISLPSSLASGLKEIKVFKSPDSRSYLYALNAQNGLFSIGENGGMGWSVDSKTPSPISERGVTLKSLLPSDGSPSSYSYVMSSDGDLAVQTYTGLSLDVLAKLVANRIMGVANNYGLATQTGVSGTITAITSNLATKAELTASLVQSRTDGINSVLSNPNLWTLYTTSQIQGMAIGDLVLTRTNGGGFVLNYDIEQSEDLVNWTPYQGFAMPLTNLPTNKAFVRIKAKQ